MSREQMKLSWQTFSDHLIEMLKNLMLSNESTDVTLVCDDKTKFKAHKFVLNACSPVFQAIINELPNKEGSIIYLRGVKSEDFESILQFMYLGEATIYQDKVDNFLTVAASFEIKELTKDEDWNNEDDSENTEYCERQDSLEEESFKQDQNTEPIIKVEDEKQTNIKKYKFEIYKYPCHKCDKIFGNIAHLQRHTKSIHEGIKYPCNICKKAFTQKVSLDKHIKCVHEHLKFPCDMCDAILSRQDRLASHKKEKH